MTNSELTDFYTINSPMEYLDYELTAWGRILSDEDNKESYMSNYAVINKNMDIDQAIGEIEAYYNQREIVPKIFYQPDSLPLSLLRPYFDRHGYELREFEERLMIFEKPPKARHIKKCVIRLFTQPLTGAEYALCIEQDFGETYGVDMINRQIKAGYRLFAAYDESGSPVCMALLGCLKGAAYISDLYTTPSARGNGYAAALMEAIKADAANQLLFLDAASENAIRLYERAGFSTRIVRRWWAVKGSLPAWCRE